jgi:APA family basic amino acid/polyamine antiporter
VNPVAKPTREEREEIQEKRRPKRALGLFDSTMIVIGVMIGSGIFIVPADMARILGGPGWFLAAWVFAAVLTIAAAFSFGELASMMPGGGGMYLYLREAYSPLWGFLYGWTLFTVIQSGTIAAVAVAFARFLGVLAPSISESRYLIPPIHLSAHYALTLSTAQLVGLLVIALLTATNALGIEYGKIIQNSFTVAKLGALGALIVLGLTVGWHASSVHANLAGFWQRPPTLHPGSSLVAILGLVMVFCVSQSGSLFAADSWHDITFASEEVKRLLCCRQFSPCGEARRWPLSLWCRRLAASIAWCWLVHALITRWRGTSCSSPLPGG